MLGGVLAALLGGQARHGGVAAGGRRADGQHQRGDGEPG